MKYIEGGHVQWSIRCFGVLKSEHDIRLVFDGTSSYFILLVWSPLFYLATSLSLGRCIVINAFQMDLDAGKMFLNFMLRKAS